MKKLGIVEWIIILIVSIGTVIIIRKPLAEFVSKIVSALE